MAKNHRGDLNVTRRLSAGQAYVFPAHQDAKTYLVGDVINDDGVLLECITDHVSVVAVDGTKWRPIGQSFWSVISSDDTVGPGNYLVDTTTAVTVLLEHVPGAEYEFSDYKLSSATNALTLGTAADSFTDESGNQVAGPYNVQYDGATFKLVAGSTPGDYIVVNEPAVQVPPLIEYQSVGYNAATNTPDLTDVASRPAAGENPKGFIITATGTQDLGKGPQEYREGGILILTGPGQNDYAYKADVRIASLTKTQVENAASTDVGLVSGQRLSEAILGAQASDILETTTDKWVDPAQVHEIVQSYNDDAAAWQPQTDYAADELFSFSTTNTTAKSIDGEELKPDKTYLGKYRVAKTSHTSLTNAEMALIELVTPVDEVGYKNLGTLTSGTYDLNAAPEFAGNYVRDIGGGVDVIGPPAGVVDNGATAWALEYQSHAQSAEWGVLRLTRTEKDQPAKQWVRTRRGNAWSDWVETTQDANWQAVDVDADITIQSTPRVHYRMLATAAAAVTVTIDTDTYTGGAELRFANIHASQTLSVVITGGNKFHDGLLGLATLVVQPGETYDVVRNTGTWWAITGKYGRSPGSQTLSYTEATFVDVFDRQTPNGDTVAEALSASADVTLLARIYDVTTLADVKAKLTGLTTAVAFSVDGTTPTLYGNDTDVLATGLYSMTFNGTQLTMFRQVEDAVQSVKRMREWDAATTYETGEQVQYGPSLFIAVADNTNRNPQSDDGTNWLQIDGATVDMYSIAGDAFADMNGDWATFVNNTNLKDPWVIKMIDAGSFDFNDDGNPLAVQAGDSIIYLYDTWTVLSTSPDVVVPVQYFSMAATATDFNFNANSFRHRNDASALVTGARQVTIKKGGVYRITAHGHFASSGARGNVSVTIGGAVRLFTGGDSGTGDSPYFTMAGVFTLAAGATVDFARSGVSLAEYNVTVQQVGDVPASVIDPDVVTITNPDEADTATVLQPNGNGTATFKAIAGVTPKQAVWTRANAGTWVTIGALQFMMSTNGNRSFRISATTSIVVRWVTWSVWSFTRLNGANNSTAPATVALTAASNLPLHDSLNMGNNNDKQSGIIEDITNDKRYEFHLFVGFGYNNNVFVINEI